MSKPLVPQPENKKNTIKVLIVDDIPETRDNLKKLLAFEPDIDVIGTAGTGREGLELAQEFNPDIILMDINMPDMDGIAATEAIRKAAPRVSVIMMSVQNETDYMRRAMLAGARYFLTKPISGEELYSTVRSVYDTRPQWVEAPSGGAGSGSGGGTGPDPERHAHVIVVYSPQGGVGKTTIATNVAGGLMKEGTKVLLIDGSMQFGDVGVYLNLQSQTNIIDLLKDLDDMDKELVDSVLVTHDSGLRVLLAPPRPEDAEMVSAEKVPEMVEKLSNMFDFIVIDLSSELNDLAVGLFDIADRILLVATPTLPAVRALKIILGLMDQLSYPADKVCLVFNRVTAEFERTKVSPSVAMIETNLKRKSLGVIPMDEKKVLTALNRGTPVIAKDRNLSPAKELLALADSLWASLTPTDELPQMQPSGPGSKPQSSRLSRLFGS